MGQGFQGLLTIPLLGNHLDACRVLSTFGPPLVTEIHAHQSLAQNLQIIRGLKVSACALLALLVVFSMSMELPQDVCHVEVIIYGPLLVMEETVLASLVQVVLAMREQQVLAHVLLGSLVVLLTYRGLFWGALLVPQTNGLMLVLICLATTFPALSLLLAMKVKMESVFVELDIMKSVSCDTHLDIPLVAKNVHKVRKWFNSLFLLRLISSLHSKMN